MNGPEGDPAAEVRRLLGIALGNPAEVARLEAAELDLLIQLARRVRLHGRLCADLKRLGVFDRLPPVARDQLSSALVMAEGRERVARWELDRISYALRDEPDLTLICMKGCAYLLLHLPNTAGRIFADVDLLVPESQLGRAEETLNRHGWATKKLSPYDDNYYRRWSHELPPLVHVERDVEIDLHHSIAAPTSRLKPDPSKLIHRSREIPGSRFRVPAGEDLVLHAMVHLMFGADLSDKLRDLADIGDLLHTLAGEDAEFWDRLRDRARELGLTRPAYYGLRYCAEYLNSAVPNTLLDVIADWAPPLPARWLMDRLVPRALYPPHPERPSTLTTVCRLLLYMRSHWIRMPPWLLAYHLSYKFFAKRFSRRVMPEA